jgi:predicted nucleic acid-binding protein
LSNLAVIGKLSIIQQIYSGAVIPPAVHRELTDLRQFKSEIAPLVASNWLQIQAPRNTELVQRLLFDLDAGEAAAIALAVELNADRLLIDERLGRTVALQLGLKITGLLGILTASKELGLITEVKPILDNLVNQAGFRVSQALYIRTLRQVGEE